MTVLKVFFSKMMNQVDYYIFYYISYTIFGSKSTTEWGSLQAHKFYFCYALTPKPEIGFGYLSRGRGVNLDSFNIRPIIQIQSSSFPANLIICWQVTARTGWCLPRDFPCSLDPFSVTWTPSMKSAPRNKKATSSSPTPTMSLCKYFYLRNFQVIPWVLSVSVLEFFSKCREEAGCREQSPF